METFRIDAPKEIKKELYPLLAKEIDDFWIYVKKYLKKNPSGLCIKEMEIIKITAYQYANVVEYILAQRQGLHETEVQTQPVIRPYNHESDPDAIENKTGSLQTTISNLYYAFGTSLDQLLQEWARQKPPSGELMGVERRLCAEQLKSPESPSEYIHAGLQTALKVCLALIEVVAQEKDPTTLRAKLTHPKTKKIVLALAALDLNVVAEFANMVLEDRTILGGTRSYYRKEAFHTSNGYIQFTEDTMQSLHAMAAQQGVGCPALRTKAIPELWDHLVEVFLSLHRFKHMETTEKILLRQRARVEGTTALNLLLGHQTQTNTALARITTL